MARAVAEAGGRAAVLDVAATSSDRFPPAGDFDFPLEVEGFAPAIPAYRGEGWLRRKRIERRAHREIVGAIRALFRRFRSHALVLTNNQAYVHYLFAAVARARGIGVLVVQPCLVLPEAEQLLRRSPPPPWKKRLLRGANRGFARVAGILDRVGGRPPPVEGRELSFGRGPAHLVAVMGERYASLFAREGVSPRKLRVTGNPLYDEMVRRRPGRRWPALARRLGVPAGPPVVVYTTQPHAQLGILDREAHAEMNRTVVRAVLASHPEVRLVVKIHPRERVDDYRPLAGDRVVVTADAELHPLLAGADCSVTGFSTTGLESVLLGTPLVSAELHPHPMFSFYRRQGVREAGRGESELAEVLRRLLAGESARREVLARQRQALSRLALCDGRALDRVLSCLEESVRRAAGPRSRSPR